MRKHVIITLVLFFATSFSAQCQYTPEEYVSTHPTQSEEVVKKPRASAYATLGSFMISAALIANLEFQLFSMGKNSDHDVYLNVGGGPLATIMVYGYYYKAGLTGVFGSGSKHFEFGLGVGTYYQYLEFTPDSHLITVPTLTLGYRYQKPEGGILYRAGFNFPEGAYLSVGTSF
ncbi:MAG: hypothetical protein SchgKO_23220 [Schleiferiaceae bacterium]